MSIGCSPSVFFVLTATKCCMHLESCSQEYVLSVQCIDFVEENVTKRLRLHATGADGGRCSNTQVFNVIMQSCPRYLYG